MTELRAEGIAAYYCDASTYLNLNDPQLGLAELLMTALAGLADATRREFGAGFLADNIWQRTKRLMKSNVQLKPSIKADVGGAEIDVEATLQENPDFRKELIDFARSSTRFYDEAVKYAEDVAEVIRDRTKCTKIVLAVDSLERLSAPTGDEKKLFDSLKEIFFNDPSRLRFPSFSVVYSAPPYLHAVLPNVGAGFSQSVTLPNFKVIDPPEGSSPPARNAEGIGKMLDIVARRFPNWDQVFAKPVLEELAWMSGGNVRRYFNLVRAAARKSALSRAVLPITDPKAAPVVHALSEAAQPLQWVRPERLDHAVREYIALLPSALPGFEGLEPDVTRQRSITLDDIGAAELQEGRLDAALAAYRESLEIRRQLRATLGETPQVLQDLAYILSRLVDASADASDAAAAHSFKKQWTDVQRRLEERLAAT